jgi:hypothetical protein
MMFSAKSSVFRKTEFYVENMSVTFTFTCSGCGATGTSETEQDMGTLNARKGISLSAPCPACGHELSLPPGKYVRDGSDMMVRVGDYDATPEPDPNGNTIAQFSCECGTTLSAGLGVKMATLNIGGQFKVANQNCPTCERPLALPPGHYKTDESGILVRVGDFAADATSAADLRNKLN